MSKTHATRAVQILETYDSGKGFQSLMAILRVLAYEAFTKLASIRLA